MLQHFLIKGGDINNAIVVVDKPIPQEKLDYLAGVFHKQNVKARRGFWITKLRYISEPARHKLLDIVGDLALVGAPIGILSWLHRPGHVANVAFARQIKEIMEAQGAFSSNVLPGMTRCPTDV